jgi:hypothetical protein
LETTVDIEFPKSTLLPDVGNMAVLDNKLMREAQEVLRARLPQGWQTDFKLHASPTGDASADAHLDVRGPDGRAATLAIHSKRTLQPRGVIDLRARLQDAGADEPVLVIAPYLSPAVRQRLAQLGMGFLDLTGNIRLALTSPALFIDARGADVDPDRKERPSRSLRGGKAGRVVRMLIDRKEPPGVRELAETAGVNAGYVSRVMALLDRQALIERKGRGRIVSVDWPRLLERWAQDAPLMSRGKQTICLDPRGISATTSRLAESGLRYAVTGSLAVSGIAPVAAARLLVVYVDSANEAVPALDLRITERGANVMLIEPGDDGVYEGSSLKDRLRVVAVSQAAADLLTSPGRGPAEADALISWMKANEEAWRG